MVFDERLGGCSSILGEMHALTPNLGVRFRLTGGEATVREVWGRASARKLHRWPRSGCSTYRGSG